MGNSYSAAFSSQGQHARQLFHDRVRTCLLLASLFCAVALSMGSNCGAGAGAGFSITNGSVPDATQCQPYTVTLNVTSVGNQTGPIQWSSSGNLPPGLTLSSNGNRAEAGATISGTPTTPGTYTFTISAEVDANNKTENTSKTFTIVVNPGPCGQPPTITSVLPNSAVAGSGDVTVTITGTNLTSDAKVNFGSNQLTPSSVASDGTQLTVTIPGADLSTAGIVTVTVTTAGGNSSPFTFTVNNPVPTITSLSEGSAVAGSGDFQLTINGTNFVSGAFVGVGSGTTLVPSSITSTQITVIVPSRLIYSAGTLTFSVADPTPGGGASNTEPFIVNDTVKTNYANGPIFSSGDDSSVDDVATGIALSSSEGDMNLLNLTDLTWSKTTLFGSAASAALSGDGNTALIGSPSTSPTGSGTATVFSVQNLNWPTGTLGGTVLVPSSGTVGPLYGQFVALSEDGKTAAVGDPSSAVVWLFTRNRGAWSGGVQLSANGFDSSSGFGSSISLSGIGNILVVGASKPVTAPGQVFVYDEPSNGWATTNAPNTTLQGSGASNGDQEGASVVISADGKTIVVGAPGDNSGVGEALGFQFTNLWGQIATLKPSSGHAGDAFGTSVAASSDASTFVVGAPGTSTSSGIGAVYVYQLSGGTPNQSQQLVPYAGVTIDHGTGVFTSNFGIHVSISNDGTAIVTGGTGSDASGTGQKISGLAQ